ncbi:tRNA (adenosine(37)-N6)-threonylcarbamoyltransferase complex transferase subunit TsaD [Candidatus Kuenenbacteria bacterium CG10_big_fil_rev_8_21_14_0_10_36_11]|uniref:tRNA N6-adenosine threonylcarbamoyltransferase n=1 Tax=Candidatus Kuenenbacteria bacterium CG10_big_fil_rev_8_21_14_0_10_36_11 TaxID=1974618 RepID=A0A2M6WBB5_9BACT|nr:MAG: tRNA (adenosine(37)-N6)-threonylcarbamoyltransferase complex transferase subunit TsaD [Candidatus Kuenenbacteria bacterium CG10_big_fil_rev_8_21_14_0_10_36_11]
MRILAIETSCDETAAAILEIKNSYFNLRSNIISSQVKIHAKYGGIVPEVAARKQIEMIMPVINKAVICLPGKNLKEKIKNINYIAVTQGPGLITSLTVGVETAKTLAFTLNKPLFLVNHLEGHIYSALLNKNQNYGKLIKIKFPVLALIVSGGHTMLVLIKKNNNKIIGETLDDAVGEAFDKAAKILNLGYPGGPIIAKLAAKGNSKKFNLPRPMLKSHDFNFSFSGLKTALLYLVRDLKRQKKLSTQTIQDICASFEQACVDVLIAKTLSAIEKFKPSTFILGGGVAANQLLRQTLAQKIRTEFPKIKILMPEMKFTGDNAAMIALAGYYMIGSQIKFGMTKKNNYKRVKAEPNLKLSA